MMKKYLINLDRRTDKLDTVTKELNRVGITNWERFSAIEAPEPRDGCRMSHLSILNNAPKNQLVAIFEDDVKFLEPLSFIAQAMRELPSDWDILWLGATLTKDLERYSEHLFRLKGGWTTHAYILNNQNGIIDYILNHSEDAFKIDVYFADVIQEKFNCYITYPMAATQQEGYSDIIKRHTDYAVIKDWYSKHTKN